MTHVTQKLSLVLLLGLSIGLLSGCQNGETGPVEKAGQQVDQAVVKVGEKIEQAGESIQESAQADKKQP